VCVCVCVCVRVCLPLSVYLFLFSLNGMCVCVCLCVYVSLSRPVLFELCCLWQEIKRNKLSNISEKICKKMHIKKSQKSLILKSASFIFDQTQPNQIFQIWKIITKYYTITLLTLLLAPQKPDSISSLFFSKPKCLYRSPLCILNFNSQLSLN
jgi:hypothetical protein